MSEEEYEFEDLSREEAAAMLYRLADGVAVGSVTIGDRTVAVPDRLEVEIEREDVDDERELEVELEWPLSVEGDVTGSEEGESDESDPEATAPGDVDADAAAVEDAPAEAPTEEALTDEETGEADAEEASVDEDVEAAPDPTAVVEPGEVAQSGSNATFELFEDAAGEWRWRLVHANGNIIADSGEGYSSKTNARKGLRSVQTNAPEADVVEE